MSSFDPHDPGNASRKFGQEIADLVVSVGTLAARVELKRIDVIVGGDFVDESPKARDQYTRAKEHLRELQADLEASKRALAEALDAALLGRSLD
jgi:DNA-binding sugar fermentation-stimulating protein